MIIGAVLTLALVASHGTTDRHTAAIAACETFVERNLTSPGSARFRDPSSYSGTGNGPWLVNASVDSQNGFGALVRTTYSCTVTYDSAADTWTLNELVGV